MNIKNVAPTKKENFIYSVSVRVKFDDIKIPISSIDYFTIFITQLSGEYSTNVSHNMQKNNRQENKNKKTGKKFEFLKRCHNAKCCIKMLLKYVLMYIYIFL